jgi:rubredoxin
MKEMVRCKACGFVLEKGSLGEVCPACGVKKEMFEPWADKVGAARRLWLDLHLHPIVVHIPQTLAVFLLLLAAAYPLVPETVQTTYFWPMIQAMAWLFPLSVLGGLVSGLVDGKVRYRKLSAPLLMRKSLVGSLFLTASLAEAALVTFGTFGPGSVGNWSAFLAAAVVSLASAAVLGKWGAALFIGAMPGDKVFLQTKKKAKPAT